MATYTSVLNLKKPAQTDYYNVDDFNGNVSIIDTAIGKINDNLISVNTELNYKADTNHTHAAATTTANGFMSAADKFKIDGIADNNLRRGCVVRDSSTTSTPRYYKFASISFKGISEVREIALKVNCNFTPKNGGKGILLAGLRSGSSGELIMGQITYKWELADDGINPEDFIMAYKIDDENVIDVELYVKLNTRYMAYLFEIISEGNHNKHGNFWNLYSPIYTDAVENLPEGYSTVISELNSISNPIANTIPYYSCTKKIADGLDVYGINDSDFDDLTDTVTLAVSKNYGVGDTFGVIFDSDFNGGGDITINLTCNGTTIHTGIIDDADDVSLSDFDGGVLYRVTIKMSTGYIFEKTDTNTTAVIKTNKILNAGDVFFLKFAYAANIYSGVKLQTNCSGVLGTDLNIYDNSGKKITVINSNKMYLFSVRNNGFYEMTMN